ncbi:TetR/AcrR family transcriptional regulator [Cellulomonas endometrii]|uniref:TetR/AcrR family transcriptional regulator n=1 Tax=Cellulomonas endometrii TaxID=3036301 RepID=UPI0024AD68E8|nr:helix-turn-helix domain-containing protein [Cellulomonas endometrii]
MTSSHLLDGTPVRLRADAERNRTAIVSAARAVFAEAGTDVPIRRVARRAGVAPATLYRRFPTREDLVAAAFTEQHAACSRLLAAADNHPDAWAALRAVVRRFCADQVRDRGFTARVVLSACSGDAPPGTAGMFAAEAERLSGLIRRARDVGAVRADVRLADLELLVAGNAGVIAATPAAFAEAASRRYVELALRSLEA